MRWTGEIASRRTRPSHTTKARGPRTHTTDLDAVEFWRYCLGPRGTSDGRCENGWSHRFAGCVLSLRNRFLIVLGGLKVMSLCCLFQVKMVSVVSAVRWTPFMCLLRYHMCLACGSLKKSIPTRLSKDLYRLLCRGMHRCPRSRDAICVPVFCECQKLTLTN